MPDAGCRMERSELAPETHHSPLARMSDRPDSHMTTNRIILAGVLGGIAMFISSFIAHDLLPIEPNDQPTEELVEIVFDPVLFNLTHFNAEFHRCLSIGPRSARPRPEFQLVSGQRPTLWRPDCLVHVEFSFSTQFFFKRLAIFTIQPSLRATPSGNSPGPKADSCL